MRTGDTLTYGSLFSGVGGFDLGFDRAGFSCHWQVEINKICQDTLAYRWPEVSRWGDVCEVSGTELQPVDVVVFGSPCQDLSLAGRQDGLEGSKSVLFFEAIRIVQEMRNATNDQLPQIVIWENVPGALNSNKGDDFEAILFALADCGAVDIEWRVLDAQFFGIPARRRRLFVVAVLNSALRTADRQELLPLSQSTPRDLREDRTGIISFYRTHGRQDQPQKDIAPTLKAIAPVCIAGTNQPPRVLTPIEHERLMGWPDDHTRKRVGNKINTTSARYQMCGNGIASPVSYWVAKHIKQLIDNKMGNNHES